LLIDALYRFLTKTFCFEDVNDITMFEKINENFKGA